MRAYVRTYTCAHTYACRYTRTYVRTYTCMRVCVHVCVCLQMCAASLSATCLHAYTTPLLKVINCHKPLPASSKQTAFLLLPQTLQLSDTPSQVSAMYAECIAH